MKLKIYFWILAFGFWLLASECAQIVQPTGGPKDILPPKVQKYVPDSAAIHFHSKTIAIVFNEFIQLTDLQKELTISPPMNIQPEVQVKGKMLLIELKDSLRENTTYTLNFGNAVRDINEGNTKTDFQYIFSTGSYIDTLTLSGTVKNAFDQKTEKGILVMLYESLEDSVPYKKRPSYFSKTSAEGNYTISHIRPGIYKAFALKEENGTYKYDSPQENISFPDSLIKIYKNTKLDLRLFKEEPKQQRLLKSLVRGYGNLFLLYQKPVQVISYKALNKATPTETFITEFNAGRDTVQVWFPKFGTDSLHFQVKADENILDTIKVCTCQFRKEGGGRGQAFKLNTVTNVSPDARLDLAKNIQLRFNHPINKEASNPKNVYLISNARRIDHTNPDSVQVNVRSFRFKFPLVEDSTYQLNILPAAFMDIFGLTNDTFKLKFRVQEEKFYGTLKLILKMKYRITFVLQLVNDKGVVFEPGSSAKGIFSYAFLPPGNYTLRVIYDTNGDGKWTPGNYTTHIQPEKIIYYPSPIIIRSNWDSELEWKVE